MLSPTLLTALILATSPSAPDTLTIELANGGDRERETAALLRDLYGRHDFRDWVVTRRILIDIDEIPHSHPVLTLHTRHLEEPDDLLATFLHEEFHWWVNEREEATEAAMARFREIWPDVPSRENGGARDDYSTYLHLVVCDLEYQATSPLLGEPAARAALGGFTHYQWIYERVLGDPRVREVLTEHGLVLR